MRSVCQEKFTISSNLFKTFKKILATESKRYDVSFEPSNEDLLQLIDSIYIASLKAIKNNKHHVVLYTLDSLISFDVGFRKIIAHQLTGGLEDHEILSENKLNFAVLMQSYYNGFRINLLTEIVNHINEYYNQVALTIEQNFQKSMSKYKYASDVNVYYINGLRNLYKDRHDKYDHNTEKIYDECIKALNELRTASVNHLRQLFRSTAILTH